VAGDTFQKVAVKEEFSVRADTWNAFLDAAIAERARANNIKSDDIVTNTNNGIIRIRNQSGVDQAQFAILGLAGVIITPSTNEPEFRSRFAFNARLPGDAELGPDNEFKYVILQEPIKAGDIGKGMISGTTPVRMIRIVSTDDYANVVPGETTFLVSGHSGSARILYFDPLTALGVVQFPINDGQRITIINASGEIIPEGASMRIISADAEAKFTFTVGLPDKDHQLNVFPLVGPPLSVNGVRHMRVEPIMRFAVVGLDIEPGDFIGVIKNAFFLEKTKFGFLVLAVQSSVSGRFAYVYFNGMTPILKAIANQEQGGPVFTRLVDSNGNTSGSVIPLKVIPPTV